MFSFLKKFSAISIVFSVICAVAAVVCLMLLAPNEFVDNTLLICVGAFTCSISVVALILSAVLWNLSTELSVHVDSNLNDISKLKKRVDELEKR